MKTGFIGLGIMGKPMAKNLIKAGIELMVMDINHDAVSELVSEGAEEGSYEQIGKECGVIFIIVPDGKITKEILFGKEGWRLPYKREVSYVI